MEVESPSNHSLTVPEIDASSLPFPSPPVSIVLDPAQIPVDLQLLPMERAISLCGILWECMAWMFSIVSRNYLVEELIPAVYKPNQPDLRGCSSHDLALLLAVLAIGELVDLGLNNTAQRYIRLAWSTALLPRNFSW
jgi:hypothetical protein